MWNRQKGVHLDAATGRASVAADLLAQIPLFATADPATLAELAGWFVTERFDSGRAIIRQGEAGDRLYIIARGTVEVVVEDAASHRKQLAKLTDGDYFGEIALLSDEPRNATVEAVGPCVCLSLQREYFQSLLEREPALRAEIERVAKLRTTASR
jgi:ATP-binding cassette, subfamily B, bacterial